MINIAQLVRVSNCDFDGCGFKSHYLSFTLLERMTEWLKVVDCKSIRKIFRRFESYFFQ